MMPFFSTGLPRSRSAWLAAYLSYNGSICFHDAFTGVKKINDFPKLFTERPKASGVSDPALVLHWEKVAGWFPDAKWVVIERPFEEVIKSCQRIWPSIERQSLWAFADKLGELIENLNPLVIDFHSITPEVVMKIADYCGVDAGSISRAEMMCKFNIQVEPTFLISEIERITKNPPQWMSKE